MSEDHAAQSDIAPPQCLTRRERRILRELHAQYLEGRDFLSARELGHLRFLRWLHRTGRLTP